MKSKRKGVIDFHITLPLNGTEKRVSHISSSGRRSYYFCDGFRESHNYDHDVNNIGTIWDFLGRHYHGCKFTCIKQDRKYKPLHPHTRQTADQFYEATINRQKYHKILGYKYISIWVCKFRKQIEDNPELKHFLANLDIDKRLYPRIGWVEEQMQ